MVCRNLYEKALKRVLAVRRAVMVITAVMTVLTVWLFHKDADRPSSA